MGCSGQGDISGVVTYKGKPLAGGTIAFYIEDKAVFSNGIDLDGSYTVTNVPTGTAKIAVMTILPIAIPGAPKPAAYTPIPARYNDREKSGLTYQVRSGSQTHNLDLRD
jgi:hypothetical protein